eukprot:6220926-Alexandrium_andersonii.AAC.1
MPQHASACLSMPQHREEWSSAGESRLASKLRNLSKLHGLCNAGCVTQGAQSELHGAGCGERVRALSER